MHMYRVRVLYVDILLCSRAFIMRRIRRTTATTVYHYNRLDIRPGTPGHNYGYGRPIRPSE